MNRTKDAIIEAFWQLLEEKAYNKITVKDIVNRCQINRNTFYYHFHDIPELLEETVKSVTDQIIRTYAPYGSPNDCLEPIVEQLLIHKQAVFHIYRSFSLHPSCAVSGSSGTSCTTHSLGICSYHYRSHRRATLRR